MTHYLSYSESLLNQEFLSKEEIMWGIMFLFYLLYQILNYIRK